MKKAKEVLKTEKEGKKGSDHTSQGTAKYEPGTTTQGGSDYGQGSSQLGSQAYKQGEKKNEGSNYNDEQGFDEV